ncbi:MAG: serine/threonine protein kinase [Nannocystaceae bacterium]
MTEPGSVMGTPAYMAPEQWRGQTLDARSDQYAFCVALFECLYGQLPFTGSTLASLMIAVFEDAPHPIPPGAQVDTAVHAAILRGLAREPNDRWPAMEPLLQELQTFVDSQLPGFLETSPVVVFKFVAPVFLLLPLVWLGLEWTDVVPYSPRSWLFVSGAQVLVLGSSILALHKPLSALLGHPRIIGLPALAMLFTLGHRAITLATNSSVEAMFIYDFLAFAGVASIVTYLVERTMWPMVALMLGLTVTATVFPSWSPRLWLGFSLGLPLSLLLLVPDPTGKRQKS